MTIVGDLVRARRPGAFTPHVGMTQDGMTTEAIGRGRRDETSMTPTPARLARVNDPYRLGSAMLRPRGVVE